MKKLFIAIALIASGLLSGQNSCPIGCTVNHRYPTPIECGWQRIDSLSFLSHFGSITINPDLFSFYGSETKKDDIIWTWNMGMTFVADKGIQTIGWGRELNQSRFITSKGEIYGNDYDTEYPMYYKKSSYEPIDSTKEIVIIECVNGKETTIVIPPAKK